MELTGSCSSSFYIYKIIFFLPFFTQQCLKTKTISCYGQERRQDKEDDTVTPCMRVPRSEAGSAGTPSLLSVPLLSQKKRQIFLTSCRFLNSLLPCEARPGIKASSIPQFLSYHAAHRAWESWTALGIRIPEIVTDVSSSSTAQQAGGSLSI